MANGDDPRVYQALVLPNEALEKGGVEILRAGIIEDELYVSARPAFKDAAQWGEVLAETARRLGAIYAAQNPALSKRDVTVQIAEAFAADMGAKPVVAPKSAGRASQAAKKPAKKPATKTVKSASARKKR